jgi:PAS domain S-box-containing protein
VLLILNLAFHETIRINSCVMKILPFFFHPPLFRPRARRGLLILCSLSLFLLSGTANLAAYEGRHVLVLNSYHQGYAWSDRIMDGIREEFAESGMEIELDFEYMDTQQHEPAKLFPLLEELYRTKFADHHLPYDVVIVSDNSALDFLIPRREMLVPGVPVVFTGINDYEDAMLAGKRNITGVAEDFDPLATIDTALALHPGTENLAVVSDVTATGRINYQRFLEIKPLLPAGLRTIDLVELTAGELQQGLRELPDRTIIFILSYYRDPTGRVFSPDTSMQLLLENSRAPIYTAWDFIVRRGALGGIVASGEIQGREAARMAVDILRGRPADEIPILRESPNVPMFNYRQMQRFGLRPVDLPAGSIVVEEPETFYQQHRTVIWGAASLLLLQLVIITGLIVNIIRRRRAEMELRISESKFHDLFEQSSLSMQIFSPDGLSLEVNRAWETLWGMRAEDAGNYNILEDKQLAAKGSMAFIRQGFAGKATEIPGIRYDPDEIGLKGRSRDVKAFIYPVMDEGNRVRQVVLMHLDITEQERYKEELARYHKHLEDLVRERTADLAAVNQRLQEEVIKQQQTERSLRESEEKYRNLVERANDGIMIVKDERLAYANPEMTALLGYPQEELIGLALDRILPPDVFSVLQDRHTRRVAGERVPQKYETTLVDRNGAFIAVEFNVGLTQYAGGPASLIFVRDIRERKQLEEERTKVGKLESIGVLAGGIAHDFNNLLTGVLGNVSFARLLVDKGSKTASLLDNAEKISLRARDLAQQLITFSEGGAPRKEKVDLAALLEATADGGLVGTSIRRRFRFQEDLQPVEGDPDQLRQLIAILVLNAREAMAEEGELAITAENVVLEANEYNRLKAGPYVKFTCTDTGRGIAPEDLPRIFDPYFTTKQMGTKKGMGLGLSIAYSIVRRHEGHIEAQSKVGRGTTVTVHLPAMAGSSSAAEEPGGSRGRILIVDDEPVVREVVAEMLRHLGYGVAAAGGASEALAQVRRAMDDGLKLDAVLIDLSIHDSMGGADELAQQILSFDPEAVIIAALGFSRDPVIADCRRSGFRAAVHKPYQFRELAAVLQQTLER